MKIDHEAIKRHKILGKLIKDVKPRENEETWANGPFNKPDGSPDRIDGTHTVTLEVADDFKSAVSVSTCTFSTHYKVTVHHFTIKGMRISTDFDKKDKREGIFYTDYQAAVKHLEDHRKWFAIHHPDMVYKGCGSCICMFCKKFAELGKVPESL
jgi:hypothetical protein